MGKFFNDQILGTSHHHILTYAGILVLQRVIVSSDCISSASESSPNTRFNNTLLEKVMPNYRFYCEQQNIQFKSLSNWRRHSSALLWLYLKTY